MLKAVTAPGAGEGDLGLSEFRRFEKGICRIGTEIIEERTPSRYHQYFWEGNQFCVSKWVRAKNQLLWPGMKSSFQAILLGKGSKEEGTNPLPYLLPSNLPLVVHIPIMGKHMVVQSPSHSITKYRRMGLKLSDQSWMGLKVYLWIHWCTHVKCACTYSQAYILRF